MEKESRTVINASTAWEVRMDIESSLHDFAAGLGLKRSWCQDKSIPRDVAELLPGAGYQALRFLPRRATS